MPRKLNDADSSQFPYRGNVSPTSTGLIVRIKDGESEAWSRFVTLYTPLIRYWCRKPGGGKLTRQDRQDVTQEVLRKVSQSIGDFDENRPGRQFRAWLQTITANTIADQLEHIAKRLPVSRLMSDTGHFKYPAQKPIDPFELAEEPEQERILIFRGVMDTVKSEFSKRDWEIMQLFVFGGRTSSEVAEAFDMKPDTVRRLKNRILKRIREEYELLGINDELPDW